MEKVQTEVMSMLQMGVKAGYRAAAEAADSTFNKLLKEQNQADSKQTQDSAVSGRDSGDKTTEAGKDETKPVQESKAEDEAEKEDGVQGGKQIPLELFWQLQENAGQAVTLQTEEAAKLETVQETLQIQPEAQENTALEIPSEAGLLQAAGEATEAISPEFLKETPGEELQVSGNNMQTEPVQKNVQAPEEGVRLSEASQTEKQQTVKEPEVMANTFGKAKEDAREEGSQEPQISTVVQQPREYGFREQVEAPTVPVRTSESTVVNDVGHTLAQRFPESNGTLTIELEPASLGKLTIQVLYESGKATVSILATNPRTLELLSSRATELASILEERTGQETVIYTGQPEGEQPYHEQQREGQQREQRQESQERKGQADQDSFLQQLRLGFV
ncbi:MAG: hypothetical protein HFI68_01140 [Lachnospiraceae bacterium]|nr:hypothetical protein [Lachnospiraceae bacterium]